MSLRRHNPFRLVGTLTPSTAFLSEAMTKLVLMPHVTSILEVGAGTGALTKSLIKKMTPHQHGDVVEIFLSLCKLLEKRFAHRSNLKVHCSDILHFEPQTTYDLIICSLPFNAFLPEMTQAVLEKLVMLARPGAYISFFEYRIIQGMASWVMPKKKYEQFKVTREIIEQFIRRYQFEESIVYLNFPPAVVHYLRIDKP